MGLIRTKKDKLIELQKAQIAGIEFQITQQNELYRSLYEMLSTGMPLDKDSRKKDYVKKGYEGNPDVFAIVTKLAGLFASPPLILEKLKGDAYVPADDIEIDWLKGKINYFQSMNEFRRQWAISMYITGDSITYAPRYENGLNKGHITKDGLIMMPSQDVTIISGGWRNPVAKYILDINQKYEILPQDVWHERFAPTLDYTDGRNFMGLSPIKVAANIINAQNKGYEVTAKMYSHGHPPGILSKKTDDYSDETTAEQENKFRERYRSKYQGVDNMTVPIFTLGELAYTKIGYDNLKELQVIETSQHGLRILCNVLQVPSTLFNDMAASTESNVGEGRKSVYIDRIIPDLNTFCEGLNSIVSAYGDYRIRPDLSSIPALQEEKEKKAQWVSKMYNDGVLTGDQYLELMGQEPTGDPDMQQRYRNMNRVPADFQDVDITESDKFYIQRNIQNAM